MRTGSATDVSKKIANLLFLAAMIGALAACKKDTRTPFETFLDCNEAMKSATSEDAYVACYTAELRQEIIDDRFGDLDHWLAMRASDRPDEPRLFRATVVIDGMARDLEIRFTDGETVQLLIFEPRWSAFWRNIVEMTRVSGTWKISRDEDVIVGGWEDGQRPDVSLSFTGGTEWTSDNDVYLDGTFGPQCRLQIDHVFETYASVQIPLDCAILSEPGTYTVEDLSPRSPKPIYVTAPGLGGLDEVREGTLEIVRAADNRISGTFSFQASHRDLIANEVKTYTVSGSFEDVPFH